MTLTCALPEKKCVHEVSYCSVASWGQSKILPRVHTEALVPCQEEEVPCTAALSLVVPGLHFRPLRENGFVIDIAVNRDFDTSDNGLQGAFCRDIPTLALNDTARYMPPFLSSCGNCLDALKDREGVVGVHNGLRCTLNLQGNSRY